MNDCAMWCVYFGVLLIFATIFTSPIVGVLVVKPALRAARFRVANCTNIYYQRVNSYESCSWGEDESRTFPCYKVYCTFYVSYCEDSEDSNERSIQRKLASDGRPGRMYSCYYDPQDHSDVTMSKKFSLTGAINALFWPNFLFLVGVVLIVGAYLCKDGSDECRSHCCVCLKHLFCIPLWAALWDQISSCGEMSSSSNNQPVSLQGVNQRSQRRSDNHSNSEELTDEPVLEMENAPPPNYSQTVLDDDAPPSYYDALRI